MTKSTPDVLFPANSKIKEHLESAAWHGISVGALDLNDLASDHGRPHVLVMSSEEAQLEWHRVEEYALDHALYPLVVSNGEQLSKDASPLLRLAPILLNARAEAVRETAQNLLQRSAWLYRELAAVDSSSELLTQNSQCEWDRCSVGVVGLVRVSNTPPEMAFSEQLELLRLNAYSAIDRVPVSRLSTDDLWTLLLIVAIPWSRQELNKRNQESDILREFVNDTVGSRKVVMFSDESARGLLGPITGSGPTWYPTSDDPLRDQLHLLVKTPEESQALEVLFKKRLSAEDFERIISALGKES
jgi:hypothetical protein